MWDAVHAGTHSLVDTQEGLLNQSDEKRIDVLVKFGAQAVEYRDVGLVFGNQSRIIVIVLSSPLEHEVKPGGDRLNENL
jgi:hypothetical protein